MNQATATNQPETDTAEDGAARAIIYLRVSSKEQAQKGGRDEGFSLPAQREACERKAETLGAAIVSEFVDAGASGRTANRPQLKRMLEFVEREPVQYLIIHKVDRLARNRLDDLLISLALQRAGVTLVSCSENIDNTPNGRLNHGLMAVLAAYHSDNLAEELKTKVVQKAKNGGTPGKAPVGYLNVRKIENHREVRTVIVDEQRAPLVQWAFEAYASGYWPLTRLTQELAERGLTTVPTAHYIERPMVKASVHRMLHNRYYLGKVIWQGIEYDGSHPPLVSDALFNRVQELLRANNLAGEKQRTHHHYLKGSAWCEGCGSRLVITKTTNRHGQRYEYFMCVGRHQRRTNCLQSVIPIELVEQHIEEKWRHVRLDPDYVGLLTELLEREIGQRRSEAERDLNVAKRRIETLTEQRKKLLEAHYAKAIPLDLLGEEQGRIATELTAAKHLLEASQLTFATIESNLTGCLRFLTDCHATYIEAPDKLKRQMNQLVFERFLVGEDGSTEAELNDVFSILLASDFVTQTDGETILEQASAARLISVHRTHEWFQGFPAWLHSLWTDASKLITGTETPRPAFAGLGLNKSYVVPPAGFEPALRP